MVEQAVVVYGLVMVELVAQVHGNWWMMMKWMVAVVHQLAYVVH